MDDSSPLQDYSGYNRTATLSGTLTKHVSLVAGAAYAPILSDTCTADFASNVFKQGYERKAFSLSAVFKPLPGTGSSQILGNTGQMDGLVVTGTLIEFVVKFATADPAVCSYDMQSSKVAFAIGVYTGSKILLYVNEELVDSFTLTEEQKADTFATTTSNLSSGDQTGTQAIAVNAVSFYGYALAASSIQRQYAMATSIPDLDSISEVYDGETISLDFDFAKVVIENTWDTESEWRAGTLSNTVVMNDELVPQFNGDFSIPGYWYDSISLDALAVSTVYGVVIDWNGLGVAVDVSLDGTTWTSVTRGQKISIVTETFSTTNKVILVRASFVGGIEDDESYLGFLHLVVLSSGVGNEHNGRTVTYTAANPNTLAEPYQFDDSYSAFINTGGSITISPDSSPDATPIRTIELWVKPSAPFSTTFGLTSNAAYKNGAVSTTTLTSNRWIVYHLVVNETVTTPLVINVAGNIARMVVYPTQLSAQNVSDIYSAYFKTNALRVTDANTITVSETSTAVDIYAYDWAITGSG